MKRMLRAVLPLLLCLSLCLILFPCAFAEGGSDTSVRFYNAKGYDLIGLHVYHADGSELAPDDTDDGYRYLLAPGEYTYAYHDSREIFIDIEETSFTVGSAALEIPVTLTASFEENYYSIWNSAPLSEGGVDEATIRFAMPTREEVLDRLTETLLEKAGEDESGFSLSDSDVFDSTPGEISSAALQVRNAMINRQPEVQVSFSSAVKWSQGDIDSAYYDTLSTAVAHTGNHWEGDTIKKVLSSTGGSIGWAYDGSVYNYQITFTLLYKTNYTQETAVINAVSDLVSSLGLENMSDYEKVSTIHEWLYNNVNYDWEHSSDPTYQIQFTDYAALVGRKAVCQGIATAYYRLCLAAGVDARYVSSQVLNHGWNIVNVGGKYYEVDATWDSNTREKNYANPLPNYLLRGTEWWAIGHTNQAGYSTIGDELDNSSYTLYDSNSLDFIFLQAQYPVFETYVVSGSDFDPLTASVAVSAANFPDDVFRAYVSTNFDTDGNGFLSDEEIAAVTVISVSGTKESPGTISSLKGIEHFTALQYLFCNYNKLTSLDLKQNKSLMALSCQANELTSLDLSNHSSLSILWCNENHLTTLDLLGASSLGWLDCSNNQLTEPNLFRGLSLSILHCYGNLLPYLDISSCPALQECVKTGTMTIDDDHIRHYKTDTQELATDDGLMLTGGAAVASVNSVNFPDFAFRSYVSDNFDVDRDSILSEMEVATTFYIICQNAGIKDLTGVEYFTSTIGLDCSGNELVELDVSANSKLILLLCSNNKLVSLNVSGCIFWDLSCYNNELEELNLSDCKARFITCYNNKLSSLDVSGITQLYKLDCRDNQLKNLTLGNNAELNLLLCSSNQLEMLDLSGCAALTTLECGINPLTALDLSNCPLLYHLGCWDNALTGLDLSHNSELTELWCYGNPIKTLDVSACTKLQHFSCHSSQLTELWLGSNSELKRLWCFGNPLKKLNISGCPALLQLLESAQPTAQEDGYILYSNEETQSVLGLDDGLHLFTVFAPDFILPSSLTVIEDEAFAGSAFTFVQLPADIESIGWHAFADCADLCYIYIPKDSISIDADAFEGVAGMTILAHAGSPLQKYAQDRGFAFIPAA
ncbi:MAG: leucine-rich repeat protein [Oscillospiraceae bacterium]|nr:leucine-rich repeat protein [Oscillospiraceae bacterium]